MTEQPRLLVDTSAAVALLVESHPARMAVAERVRGHVLGLSGHALAETYSVLTRLPGDARVTAEDAVTLIDATFTESAILPPALAGVAHRELARCGVTGGAAYDGLVALAAREAGLPLLTRDARARATYEAVGATVEVIPD